MKVLVTGTSGTGKSAVGKELKKRGYDAIETDQDIFNDLSIAYFVSKATGKGVDMPWPPPENWHNENDWTWRIDLLGKRLDASKGPVVFACGDSRNKEFAFTLFDKIFALSAPNDVLYKRIQARTDNYFGKKDDEFAWVIDQNKKIVGEVRQAGGVVIDGSKPLSEVVDEIIAKTQPKTKGT